MIDEALLKQVHDSWESSSLTIRGGLHHYQPAKHAGALPRHTTAHWRGLWEPNTGILRGRYFGCDDLLPSLVSNNPDFGFQDWESHVLCHSKPLDDRGKPVGCEGRYPDIPDRLDIYILLRHRFNAIAFSGRSRAAVIRRTEATYPTILKLRDWESSRESGRYRRSRGRSQLRRALNREPTRTELERQHATSALRAVGLRWPRNPKERALQWLECLGAIGLTVDLTTELAPMRYYDISRRIQTQLSEKPLR